MNEGLVDYESVGVWGPPARWGEELSRSHFHSDFGLFSLLTRFFLPRRAPRPDALVGRPQWERHKFYCGRFCRARSHLYHALFHYKVPPSSHPWHPPGLQKSLRQVLYRITFSISHLRQVLYRITLSISRLLVLPSGAWSAPSASTSSRARGASGTRRPSAWRRRSSKTGGSSNRYTRTSWRSRAWRSATAAPTPAAAPTPRISTVSDTATSPIPCYEKHRS